MDITVGHIRADFDSHSLPTDVPLHTEQRVQGRPLRGRPGSRQPNLLEEKVRLWREALADKGLRLTPMRK